MAKSPDAFRTISEVAEWLEIPTHVLRFWESKFTQIKPVKRAGGRRYYRPSDMMLIGGIKQLLHEDGMTIRGAQKLLREKGVKHVAALSKPLDDGGIEEAIDAVAAPVSAVEDRPAREAPRAEPAEAEAPAGEMPAPAAADADDQPGLPFDAAPGAGETAEEEEALPRVVPPAGLPETDPADDEPAHAAPPGLAARLAQVAPERLAPRRAVLADIHARLAEHLRRRSPD